MTAFPAPDPALNRFVAAQADSFATAMDELRAGRKRSHWMWFIFPQIAGLGRSATAQHYAIRDASEAQAYLAHPILGPRLLDAVRTAIAAPGSAEAVFGGIDAMKLRSSLTLFAAVADDPTPFRAGLDRFFGGVDDEATLARLDRRA
ncbi:DUF1810 domain-containing protein [Sphingomonas sanguinis]|uniref:DUF1810 domain-containing protein n=1 Tax=Sphingomonas sp. LC-1 TaxID=3110957 RepID=UPI0021BADDD7|nr:DUF1810 domain-containing protein [Sphingomonas sp. LC-1]MCT8002846.1 DUF1810 domain-containing protein [Sphingomonas sp. LC-1]